MKLDVPLILQTKDTVECGIAGIAMLFNYYGLNKTFEEVKAELITDKIGTYAPQLGSYLMRHGFNVDIVMLHPKLFTNNDMLAGKDTVLKRLEDAHGSSKSEQDKMVIGYFISFIKDGGKLSVKIPSFEDIQLEIDNGRPIGALLTTNFMNSKVPRFNFHFNIITGYDNEHIYANDPMWDERGGKKGYLINDFFYGLYASAYADVDNASLIKVQKK